MPKIIKLTEGDLINLIKRVLSEEEMTEACWKGYTQKGMKTMFGKRYPNCVKKESAGETDEASSPAQQAAIAINMKKKGIKPKVVAVSEEQFERLFEYNTEDPILMYEDEFGSVEEVDLNSLNEAEYQGRKVQLGKIMQGDVKKSKVYVKNDKGKVVKVNFGFGGKSAHGKRMTIKKNNPERRKSFRARMNCDNPGPRWKPRYWACRTW
jgi:translation initiation factor IF-2